MARRETRRGDGPMGHALLAEPNLVGTRQGMGRLPRPHPGRLAVGEDQTAASRRFHRTGRDQVDPPRRRGHRCVLRLQHHHARGEWKSHLRRGRTPTRTLGSRALHQTRSNGFHQRRRQNHHPAGIRARAKFTRGVPQAARHDTGRQDPEHSYLHGQHGHRRGVEGAVRSQAGRPGGAAGFRNIAGLDRPQRSRDPLLQRHRHLLQTLRCSDGGHDREGTRPRHGQPHRPGETQWQGPRCRLDRAVARRAARWFA